MAVSNSHGLQPRYNLTWSDKVVVMNFRLIVINNLQAWKPREDRQGCTFLRPYLPSSPQWGRPPWHAFLGQCRPFWIYIFNMFVDNKDAGIWLTHYFKSILLDPLSIVHFSLQHLFVVSLPLCRCFPLVQCILPSVKFLFCLWRLHFHFIAVLFFHVWASTSNRFYLTINSAHQEIGVHFSLSPFCITL